MKKILTILFWVISTLTFGQYKTQKQILDSLEIKLPNGKQITPQVLKVALKDVMRTTELRAIQETVNSNVNFVAKGQFYGSPQDGQGGQRKNVVIESVKLTNATSYETQLSKSPLMTAPITYNSATRFQPLTNLDTNTVYYHRHRGKNANFTGAWSEIKKFDTYDYPKWFNLRSLFDLKEYDPLGSTAFWAFDMVIGKEYLFAERISDKQLYTKFLKVDITNFPYIVQTGIGTTVKIVGTNCIVEYAWGRDPEEKDLSPYLSTVGGNLTLSLPPSVFPISKIKFQANTLYLK